MGQFAKAVSTVCLTIFVGAQATAEERPLSAQDVMSVCVAVAHNVEFASAIFESQGWSLVDREDYGLTREDLAIAFIGARYVFPRPLHGTEEDVDFWKDAWPVALRFVDKNLGKEEITVYAHKPSGAVLLTEPAWAKPTTGMSCLLAVPVSELKRSSYFPKLRAPVAPAVSLTHGEFLHSDIVRTKLNVTSAALNAESIGSALKISTEIGAVFSSDVSHPTWALEP